MKKSQLYVMILILLITTLTFAGESADSTGDSADYSALIGEMSGYIEEALENNKVAGLSIALVDGQKTVWQAGFGYADIQNNVAADEATLYNMASVSKLFIGTAIMQLVEAGKIDLDAPLSDYLEEFEIKSRFPPRTPPVTIGTMLTHHSGLPGDMLYKFVEKYSDKSVEYYNNYEETLLNYLKEVHVANPPGYVHAYSNISYNLLGFVIQRVSGIPLVDYMRENILLPLGMENASFTPLFMREETGALIALPHAGLEPGEKYLWMAHGAGALNAGMGEMTAFIKMVLARGLSGNNRLLSEESLEKMLTLQNEGNELDGETRLGLSFFLNDPIFDYAGKNCSHSGGMVYYFSDLKILLEHDLGVVVAVNSNTGGTVVGDIAIRVLQEALKIKTGLEAPGREEEKTVEPAPEELKMIEGDYAAFGVELIKIRVKNNKVRLHIGGVNLQILPLPDGWLKPRTSHNFFKHLRFKVKLVEGKKVLFIKRYPYVSIPLGYEYFKKEISSIWKKRMGSYRFTEKMEDSFKFMDGPFRLKIKKGVIYIIVKDKTTAILEPVSENECIIGGLGRNTGESVYFYKENGKDMIFYSGYRLEKK